MAQTILVTPLLRLSRIHTPAVYSIAWGTCSNTAVRLASLARLMSSSSNPCDSGESADAVSSSPVGVHVKIKAKEKRIQQHELLRQNRNNPVLERKARTGRLFVPLSEVHSDWKQSRGIEHLQTIGHHSNIYSHIFGSHFRPCGFISVSYPGEHEVHRGNIITAKQASSQPTVTLPQGLEGYSTLILNNPDGHLHDSSQEILHWMVTNIPGCDFQAGSTLCPYLPPVPPKGTGFHRYVFSLYTHQEPLNDKLVSSEDESWLDQRTFSTQFLLSSRPELRPFTFAFFQCQWDSSVHDTYMNTLVYPEPVYNIEKPPRLRHLKNKEIKQKRSDRYRNM